MQTNCARLLRVPLLFAALTAWTLACLSSCTSSPQPRAELDLADPQQKPVYYILELTIRDGQLDPFRALMEEMVTATRQEPGTLVYEWYLAEGGKSCQIHEHFADTAAYAAHGENFGANFADRFMSLVDIAGFTVYGNADSEAREMLAMLNPSFYTALGGFRR